jgi:predicted CoA-binding protein
MGKISKDFFKDKEILFVGYSSRNKAFCDTIMKAFEQNGLEVYPMNMRSRDGFDIKVYQSFDELPKVPETAFVLMKNENTKKVIKPLMENGVKRILFQNGSVADKAVLEQCRQMGIKASVGCPLMLFGSGLHRIHGFFAGVKR